MSDLNKSVQDSLSKINPPFWQRVSRVSKNVIVQSIIFLLVIGIVLALTSNILSRFFGHYINDFLPYLGGNLWLILAAYFIYMVVQAIIFFLPAAPADVAMFALIGPKLVFVVNLSGTLIAYSVTILLARKFGRRFLKKILPPKSYQRVSDLSHNMTTSQLFVITIIPFTHLDLMPYAAGLSKIRFRTAILVLAIVAAIRLIFVLFILNVFWVK